MRTHKRPARLKVFGRRLVRGLMTPYFVLLAVGLFAVIANGMDLPQALLPTRDTMLWIVIGLTSISLLLAFVGYAWPIAGMTMYIAAFQWLYMMLYGANMQLLEPTPATALLTVVLGLGLWLIERIAINRAGWLPPCCQDAPCKDAPAHWHDLYESGNWPPQKEIRSGANV